MTTSEVENYPGFPEGITGPQLMAAMRSQAERWGAEIVADDATTVDLDTFPFRISTASSGTFMANSVIVATGASARRLRIPGEEKYWSRGVSACAVCDGAAPIYAGKDLAVVGGGDSACEEAVYLCKYANHVHLLVRSDKLRASRTLVDRATNHPSITVHFNTSALQVLGSEKDSPPASPLTGVKVRNSKTAQESVLDVRGLFYAIGHTPNTSFLRGTSRLRFDDAGYILTQPAGSPDTGLDGVFAAGDVADHEWRQAVTAAGSGCMAALAAERFLTRRSLVVEYHQNETQQRAPASVEATQSEEELKAESRGSDDEQTYDLSETWHFGQFALRKLYHESKRPLIVKYISPNCGPCRQLKPMLHGVVRAFEGQVHYVEIDMTIDPEIAEAAGVTGSPTVHIFHEKSLVQEFRGVKMKSEYKRVVEQILTEVTVVR